MYFSNMTILSSGLLIYHCLCATAVVVATAAERGKNNDDSIQTRFTFLIPTNENVSSILFGLDNKSQLRKNGPSKISFNHGDLLLTFV